MATTTLSLGTARGATAYDPAGVRSNAYAYVTNAAGTTLVTLGMFAYQFGETGVKSSTLSVPQTAMNATDKVKVTEYCSTYDYEDANWKSGAGVSASTASLNASKLDAAEWTFTRTHNMDGGASQGFITNCSVTGIAYTEAGSGASILPHVHNHLINQGMI